LLTRANSLAASVRGRIAAGAAERLSTPFRLFCPIGATPRRDDGVDGTDHYRLVTRAESALPKEARSCLAKIRDRFDSIELDPGPGLDSSSCVDYNAPQSSLYRRVTRRPARLAREGGSAVDTPRWTVQRSAFLFRPLAGSARRQQTRPAATREHREDRARRRYTKKVPGPCWLAGAFDRLEAHHGGKTHGRALDEREREREREGALERADETKVSIPRSGKEQERKRERERGKRSKRR